MATTRDEEQRWLTQRWIEMKAVGPGPAASKEKSDGNETATQTFENAASGTALEEVLCKPTLKKLYAAQRKQRRALARRIRQAVEGEPG